MRPGMRVMTAVTVRLAEPADADVLGAVSARAFEATYRGIVPDAVLDEWIETGAESWRAAFAERAPDSPSRAWVAERDGSVIGYATTSPARSNWLPPPDGAGELTNLYLDPEVIGLGVGRLLYEHAVADLRARGFDPLVVWAFRDNPRARRFYEGRGLTIDVLDHAWVLADVPCPIVRFRGSLAGSEEPMTPDELAVQRWFRSKQRPIAAVTEMDRAPLAGDTALTVLEVAYRDGGPPDRYLVPLAGDREPADGDGVWRAIVQAMVEGRALQGRAGRFVASSTGVLGALLDEPVHRLTERRLGVEQSNTSIVLGDRLILKLYRLLEAGENPDLEVSAFLTNAGFRDTPAVAGALVHESDAGTAAAVMLQAFVPSTGDAWSAMLGALAADPDRATRIAAEVGDVTERMHHALASRPASAAFPARAATPGETAAWRASAERQLAQAVTAVSGGAHARLVQLAPRITARFADTFGSAGGEAAVSRIHGDYHLGQLLARHGGGFSVIDFEGEPARPLAERREPSSPLRDVAGMLRSLDYAARTAEAGRHAAGFVAERWLDEARAALIDAYGGIGPDRRGLLDAFELEKACYEVRYEANNRPGWLWLPLAAVERLAGSA